MFEKQAHGNVSSQPPPILQFLSVEIMPMGDGRLAVSLAGTYLDEDELEFINGEIANEKVGSLDDALIVIGNSLANALGLGARQEGH